MVRSSEPKARKNMYNYRAKGSDPRRKQTPDYRYHLSHDLLTQLSSPPMTSTLNVAFPLGPHLSGQPKMRIRLRLLFSSNYLRSWKRIRKGRTMRPNPAFNTDGVSESYCPSCERRCHPPRLERSLRPLRLRTYRSFLSSAGPGHNRAYGNVNDGGSLGSVRGVLADR